MTQVLVIDDNRPVRALMAQVLARDGYEVLEADSALCALELLDNPGPALVVSDIVMPGLSGLQLLDELRARRPGMPVLLVTGAATHHDVAEALAHGAAGLLTKPFAPSELRARVSLLLERSKRSLPELPRRATAAT